MENSIRMLEDYRKYLEQPPGLKGNWSNRYITFRKAFELFKKKKGKVIVELGTTRSYVSGHLPGCLSPDDTFWELENPEKWDWGAGSFTVVAANEFHNSGVDIYTVDISEEHIRRAQVMTKPYKSVMKYVTDSSENFLKNFNDKIDLLYIDTGNLDAYTRAIHLKEAEIIINRDLISHKGTILIDDVYRPEELRGMDYVCKCEYSLPFFLQNGFEIVLSHYQTLLKKRT